MCGYSYGKMRAYRNNQSSLYPPKGKEEYFGEAMAE